MGRIGRFEIPVNGGRYRVARGGAGAALMLLHGFTGSSASWEPWLEELTSDFDVIAVDLPGHGGTVVPPEPHAEPDPGRYAAGRQVEDLAALLDALGVSQASGVGYSMGARLALAFASARPERVARLVLESGSPGIAAEQERIARRSSDEALAARIVRDGVPAFVDEWERQPLFASQAGLPEPVRLRQREQRLANRPEGLAASLRGFGQGSQPPLHDALTALPMPVLLLAGSEDARYARLAREMAQASPGARVEIIDGAGHTPHLERPERFRRAVREFLEMGR